MTVTQWKRTPRTYREGLWYFVHGGAAFWYLALTVIATREFSSDSEVGTILIFLPLYALVALSQLGLSVAFRHLRFATVRTDGEVAITIETAHLSVAMSKAELQRKALVTAGTVILPDLSIRISRGHLAFPHLVRLLTPREERGPL